MIAIGAREHDGQPSQSAFPADDVAKKYGASVERDTMDGDAAYASVPGRTPTAFREGVAPRVAVGQPGGSGWCSSLSAARISSRAAMKPMGAAAAAELDQDRDAEEHVERGEDLEPRVGDRQLGVGDARGRQRGNCEVEPVKMLQPEPMCRPASP